MAKQFFVFTDGGARGNPGPAAIGVIIKDFQGKVINKFGKYIGRTTNNVAEYTAVIEALEWIKDNCQLPCPQLLRSCVGRRAITNHQFYLDSSLVVNQLNGLFKIKNANLRNLIIKVRQLENEIKGQIIYQHISRPKNKEADTLVNQCLNRRLH